MDRPKQGVPRGFLDNSPLHLLHRAEQCASDVFQTRLASPADLTPRQFAVLATVANNEGASQTRLVELTGIDRSTMADLTRRLIKKGLLQRRKTREDARAYAVRLTPAGNAIVLETEPAVKEIDQIILAAIPSESRERFVQDLAAITKAMSDCVASSNAKLKK